MRILHVVPSYIPAWRYGGPIRSVHGLCKALVSRGHSIDVATTSVDGEVDSDVPTDVAVELDGVSVRYFPSRLLRRLYYSPPLRRFVAEEMSRWDVIHTHSVFLWPTTVAAKLARRAGKPYVLSPRGMLVRDLIDRRNSLLKRAWIELFERRNVERAAAVHVTSVLEGEELLAAGFLPARTIEIPNGLDVEATSDTGLRPPEGIPERYALFLGRISWKKGLDRLVASLVHSGISLVIAGNDDEHYRGSLEKLAAELGVTHHIHYVGFVDGEAKRTFLSNAVLLVLPSYSENFGNVVIESMALGTPVVVTPEVGAASIVAKTRSGIVVSGDPELLAKACVALSTDTQLRQEMSRNARQAARSFGWDAIAERFEEQYRSLLQGA